MVISANYRVGSLGFLAFNDGIHRGNYALSDMVAALEWVKKYIQYVRLHSTPPQTTRYRYNGRAGGRGKGVDWLTV